MYSKSFRAGIAKYRNRIGIYVDMCLNAKDGINETNLRNRSNLNARQFGEYLPLLLDCRLLEKNEHEGNGGVSYHTTGKGLSLIDEYKKLCELLKKD